MGEDEREGRSEFLKSSLKYIFDVGIPVQFSAFPMTPFSLFPPPEPLLSSEKTVQFKINVSINMHVIQRSLAHEYV